MELLEIGDVQGRNLTLGELQAAVLLERLSRLDAANALRHERAVRLAAELSHVDGVRILASDERVTERTYYNLVLRLDRDAFAGNSVDAIGRALSAELGTAVDPLYAPLNRHRLLCPDKMAHGDLDPTTLDRMNPAQYKLPAADAARQSCLTLTHPVLLADADEMATIAEGLAKTQRHAADLLALPQDASTWAF